MSLPGQPSAELDESVSVMAVCTFPMPAGTVFDWHTHADHQLAWPASGVLTVRSGTDAWVLPPTRALWIPAGVRHETLWELDDDADGLRASRRMSDRMVRLHARDRSAAHG
jgi:quercetin dioxygenase-like cupin family protein